MKIQDQLLIFIGQFKDTYQLVEFLPDSEVYIFLLFYGM